MKPFFSVVMPIYNKGPHIYRSVNSVLNQTFVDFELLLINDASTDNSLKEMQKFTDHRISILHRDQPGPGGYAARNLGIQKAQANWVAFLDADDIWYYDHLEQCFEVCESNCEVEVILFGFKTVTKDGIYISNSGSGSYSTVEMLKLYSQKEIANTNSTIVKRNLLTQVGGFPEDQYLRGGDSDLWLRLYLTTKDVYISSSVTSEYWLEYSGVMSNPANLRTKYPIVNTVKKLLAVNSQKELTIPLMRISNRKQLSWLKSAKKANIPYLKGLQFLYFFCLSKKQLMELIALTMLPRVLFIYLSRTFYYIRKYLCSGSCDVQVNRSDLHPRVGDR